MVHVGVASDSISLSVARTSTAAQLNGLICDVDVSRVLIYAMAPKQRCCINDTRMLPFYLLMLNRFFFVCCRALAELGVYLLIRVNGGKNEWFPIKTLSLCGKWCSSSHLYVFNCNVYTLHSCCDCVQQIIEKRVYSNWIRLSTTATAHNNAMKNDTRTTSE